MDSRTQEGPQRKFFCISYSLIDNWAEWKAGQIDKAEYERQRMKIIWKIYDKTDNHNYAPDLRKVDRAMAAIQASEPSLEDISETADYCHAFLRL